MADQDPDRRRVIAAVGAAARWRHPDAMARRAELCIDKIEKQFDELLADGTLRAEQAAPLAARVTVLANRLTPSAVTAGQVAR